MHGGSASKRAWIDEFRRRVLAERQVLRRLEVAWSWGRLLSFPAAAVLGTLLWDEPPQALAAVGLLLVGFVACVRGHVKARSRRQRADNLLLIIGDSATRLGGHVTLVRSHTRPADPSVAGAMLVPPFDDRPVADLTDQECSDLDLYASPVGLFGLLNRTSSSCGVRRLRDMLEHPCLTTEPLLARQQGVRWLDEHPAERMRLMAGCAELRRRHAALDKLIVALRGAAPIPAPQRVFALRIWGVLSLIASLWAFYQGGRGNYVWAVPWLWLVTLNSFLGFRMRRTLRAALTPWSELLPAVQGCREAVEVGATTLPQETPLGAIRECWMAVIHLRIFRLLERRLAWIDSTGMVHALLNVVALWDLQLAASILHVVLPHRDELLRALAALAESDALSSLAAFAWEQPNACYPQAAATEGLHIESGVHPLLDPACAVPNEVTLTESLRTWIVTGSNMAGKSTFLRMVGVNVLLAQVGTVATARAMTWRPMRIITDLRVADSLADNESYFLAEVRHIRRMVLPPLDGVPCLGLIDEPFRGTNSLEQVAGSLALGEHLIASTGFFVIATHDQRLTELADDVRARNVHFREHLDGDDLVFDYRLRSGPAQTRNALHLLEREGFPASLLDRARRWLNDGS